MNIAIFTETQRERAQSCGYKPRRGVRWAGLPPPAYMCVAFCSSEDIQSNKEFIGMSKYTPGRESLTHVLLSQPLNTTTADTSDKKMYYKRCGPGLLQPFKRRGDYFWQCLYQSLKRAFIWKEKCTSPRSINTYMHI